MIGELAQMLLQAFQRLLAPRHQPRGKNGGEYFQGVPQFLPLDPQAMNLVRFTKPTVGPCEEPSRQRPETATRVLAKRRPYIPTTNPFEQPLHPCRPIGLDQPFPNLVHGPSRRRPLAGQHRHEPAAGRLPRGRARDRSGSRRRRREPIGEHVQITGFARSTSDATKPLGEPRPGSGRQEIVEGIDGRERPPSRHTKLVDPFGIVSASACVAELQPDGLEAVAKRPHRHLPRRRVGDVGDDPGAAPGLAWSVVVRHGGARPSAAGLDWASERHAALVATPKTL